MNLTDIPADASENMGKPILGLQKMHELVAELHNQIYEMIKPYAALTSEFQKQLEPLKKITDDFPKKYHERLQQNFRDIISTIEPPETYTPSEIKLRGRVNLTILGMVAFARDMDKRAFCHLKERMLIGINAHMKEDYHLSLFCIFSVIDGMLSWFYEQEHPGKQYCMRQKLDKFFETYTFEHVIGKNEIRPKFDAFIKHRNEIMHGGKNSYFDKNLSSAALFFLGIVYSSLGDKAT